ncbi:MAG: DUF523 domain-containing protein [Desulfoprunum sp.]|nr:DUF523 domain-containing protein [Desulfoprunum sp.]
MADTIRLGISSCLLGNLVRYDGGHQHDRYLTDILGPYVEYIAVCPEVECGLGIPREALHLVGDPEAPRLVTTKSAIDHTERMRSWAVEHLQRLAQEDLDGFIFKKGSPSSGMERVKVYTDQSMPRKIGAGIFARTFMERFPSLPVEEDDRLYDPGLRHQASGISRFILRKSSRLSKKISTSAGSKCCPRSSLTRASIFSMGQAAL